VGRVPRDDIAGPLRKATRRVEVALSVEGVGQDVVVVDALELGLFLELVVLILRLDQVHKAGRLESLDENAFFADRLLTKPTVLLPFF